MSRWFRFYDDVINDPKVLKLPEATRWNWVAILCVASKQSGQLPPLDEIAFHLRTTPAKATILISALVKAGLLDKTDTGFVPHNWGGRQFLSDGSAERVRRHREKRAAAGLQSQWTPPKALRQAVYDRDGHKCVYCGSSERLSLDHRTPEIRGGTHDIDNLATACLSCNGAKRDMTETEYIASVTLLKRPQKTEQTTDTNSVAIATGADAPVDPSIAERELFDRGKQILGKSAGGQIAKLKAAKGGNVALARSVIEAASTKQNPSEYVAAAIRAGPTFAKPLTEHQRKQQETREILNDLANFAAGRSGSSEPHPGLLRHDPGGGPEGIRGGTSGNVDDLPTRRH